jgi:hypothetical protein
MTDLEDRVADLEDENDRLRKEIDRLSVDPNRLKDAVMQFFDWTDHRSTTSAGVWHNVRNTLKHEILDAVREIE